MTSPVVGDAVQWATNPKTVAQAIAFAQAQVDKRTSGWYRRCLAFCGTCYGIPFTGTAYAIDMWDQVPAAIRHASATGIPAGALLVYRTKERAGHIALYAGDGQVYSNDIKGNGYIARVPFNDLVSGTWRLQYVGWIPPYFPKNSASKLIGTTTAGTSVEGAVGVSDSTGASGAIPDLGNAAAGLQAFVSQLTDRENWINILMVVVGGALILLATVRISGATGIATSILKG